MRVFIAPSLLLLALTAAPNQVFAAAGDDALAAGQTYYQGGDYANAITTLESFVSQYPTSTSRNKGELYLGCSYLARNASASDITTARQHFNYILTQGKTAECYRDALFHNARSYYNAEDYATARTLLTQFLSEYPQDDFDKYVYYYLGVCETNVGTLDQAIAYYDRSETEFPDSPLKWYCKLEKATLLGRKGQYSQADQQLAQIAADTTAPASIVGQATIQRSLLMLVQNNAQGAVNLLDSYIQKYKSDPSVLTTVQDAYLYEAYAFFAMKEYQRALNLIDEVERLGSTLPPEAATVKIKLFLALGRIADAESLLNRLAASQYGQQTPDIITSYRSMINAVKGNRDQVIADLGKMLSPRSTGANSNTVEFNYFNTSMNPLSPLDFVEACGVLTVAYAGRYAQGRNESDNAAQEALYQATARYVNTLNDPAITMVLSAIDQARKAALTNPNVSQQQGFSVISPGGMNSGAPVGGDGFSTPNQNYQQGLPSQTLNPNMSNQPLNQNQPPQGMNQGVPGQQGYNSLAPNTNNNGGLQLPPGANQNQQPGQIANLNLPNSQYPQNNNPAGTASNLRPAFPNGQQPVGPNGQPLPNNGQQPVGPNGQPLQNNGQPFVGPNGQQIQGNQPFVNNGVNPNDPQNAGATQDAQQQIESTPLTPEEAREALDRATNFYSNLEFDRANQTLLEATTKSETFWTDCPAEAARISLLRANALLELGKRSEAQMTCEDLVAHVPNTQEASVAYYYLGALADSVGRRDDAIDYLRQATSGRGDFPYADAALYSLGTNELERGDVTSAAHTFNRVYRDYPMSPYWSHSVWRLAKINADMRNDVPAEKLVNEALGRRPDSAIVDYLLFLKGEIALRAKDYDKALVAFDMIVDQYPDSVWYSRAKNRLATIPERFLNSADASVPVSTREPADDVYAAPNPPSPRTNAPIQRELDAAPGGYSDPQRGGEQSGRSSVRIPTPSEMRSRATQDLSVGGGLPADPRTGSTSTRPRSDSPLDDLGSRPAPPRNPIDSATAAPRSSSSTSTSTRTPSSTSSTGTTSRPSTSSTRSN